jgi:hypothetical protein
MIKFTEEFQNRLASALTDGIAVVAAYTDTHGDPHCSFYGSVHAFSANEIALWARNPASELAALLASQPKISFVYADLPARIFYRFKGTARAASDAATRDRIFEGMHPFEQQQGEGREGAAILVEIEYFAGREESGSFEQTKD